MVANLSYVEHFVPIAKYFQILSLNDLCRFVVICYTYTIFHSSICTAVSSFSRQICDSNALSARKSNLDVFIL